MLTDLVFKHGLVVSGCSMSAGEMNGLMEGSWWFRMLPAQVDGLGLPLRVVRHHAAERCHSLAIYVRGVREVWWGKPLVTVGLGVDSLDLFFFSMYFHI